MFGFMVAPATAGESHPASVPTVTPSGWAWNDGSGPGPGIDARQAPASRTTTRGQKAQEELDFRREMMTRLMASGLKARDRIVKMDAAMSAWRAGRVKMRKSGAEDLEDVMDSPPAVAHISTLAPLIAQYGERAVFRSLERKGYVRTGDAFVKRPSESFVVKGLKVAPPGAGGAGGGSAGSPIGARKIWGTRVVEKKPDQKWHVVGHVAGLEGERVPRGAGSARKPGPGFDPSGVLQRESRGKPVDPATRKPEGPAGGSVESNKPVGAGKPGEAHPEPTGPSHTHAPEKLDTNNSDHHLDVNSLSAEETDFLIEQLKMEQEHDAGAVANMGNKTSQGKSEDVMMAHKGDTGEPTTVKKAATGEQKAEINARPHNRRKRRMYMKTKDGRSAHDTSQNNYQKKHPDRVKAQARNSVRDSPGSHKCAKCDKKAIHRHHLSYHPEKIQFLCHDHHVVAHHGKRYHAEKSMRFIVWPLRLRKSHESLPGGAGDDRPKTDFDLKQLAEGTKHEMEHTTNRQVASEIARDHLTEDPRYYVKIKKIEEKSRPRISKSTNSQIEGDGDTFDAPRPPSAAGARDPASALRAGESVDPLARYGMTFADITADRIEGMSDRALYAAWESLEHAWGAARAQGGAALGLTARGQIVASEMRRRGLHVGELDFPREVARK